MSELPNRWATASFGEINRFSGRTVDPKTTPEAEYELYSVPVFPTGRPELVRGNDIGSSKQSVEPNDVLVCKINPRINRVWVVGPRRSRAQIASSEWIGVRTTEFDARFLRYYFSSPAFRELIEDGVSGVGGSLTRAQPKRVATLPVPVAPTAEQSRIADKLDAIIARVNICRERLDRLPTILRRCREAVLEAAVSGRLTEDWRSGRAHSEWADTTIGDVCAESFYGPRFGKNEYSPNGIPTIRTTDMTDDGRIEISSDTPRVVVPPGRKDQFLIRTGDLLVTRTGSIGVMAVFEEDYEAIPSAYLIRFRFTKRVLSRFAFLCLVAPRGQQALGLSSTAITQPNINAEAIKRIAIRLPAIDEQTEIVRRVDELFALVDQFEAKYRAAVNCVEKLTPAVLAKAFRGKLVPPDPEDQPASMLLERIRATPDFTTVARRTATKRVTHRARK